MDFLGIEVGFSVFRLGDDGVDPYRSLSTTRSHVHRLAYSVILR